MIVELVLLSVDVVLLSVGRVADVPVAQRVSIGAGFQRKTRLNRNWVLQLLKGLLRG